MDKPSSTSSDFRLATLLAWVLKYARRRGWGVAAVLATMILKIGMDLLRPWPMKVLVDNVLGGKKVPAWLANAAMTPRELVTWCVGGMIVIFLLGWTLRAAGAMAGVSLGQRVS